MLYSGFNSFRHWLQRIFENFSPFFIFSQRPSEVLFSADGRWEKMKKGEKFSKIRCNQCRNEFTKAKAEFVRVEPVEIRVNCPKCKVKGEAKAKPLDEADWELYIKIEGGPTRVVHEGDDKW